MNEPMLSIHAMSGALYVCAGAGVCVQVSVCGCGWACVYCCSLNYGVLVLFCNPLPLFGD